MVILFANTKLKKMCNDYSLLQRRRGARQAEEISDRLNEANDLPNLKAWGAPAFKKARLHPLLGNLKGQFAVDLNHPYRLVFEPTDKFSKFPDGGIDIETVTAIRILEIIDYH